MGLNFDDMRKHFITIATPALFVALFAACVDKIDIFAPEFEDKLTVNGYFEADSTIKINLTKNKAIDTRPRLDFVEDARIVVTSADSAYELGYTDNGFYVSGSKLCAGMEYTIQIKSGVYGEASATASVPDKPAITGLKLETDSFTRRLVTVSFDDNAQTNDFYMVKVKANREVVNYIDDTTEERKTIFTDIVFFNTQSFIELYLYNTKVWENNGQSLTIEEIFKGSDSSEPLTGMVFSDKQFNGGECQLVLEPHFYSEEEEDIFVCLYKISRDLYEYYGSMADYNLAGDDPFSEPKILFSNISGGLGLVGAQSCDCRKYVYKPDNAR